MHMHGHAACACLTAPRFSDDAEAGGGVSGCANAPSNVGRQVPAAGADGRECRATCDGKSRRSGRAQVPVGTLTSELRWRSGSLCACRDAANGCIRVRDGVDVRPVQSGCQSE